MAKKTSKKTVAKTAEETAATPKKAPRAKVRLAHPDNPHHWVRAFVDVVEKYGVPKTDDGRDFVASRAPRGISAEERAKRAAAKEEEKAKLAAMSDEEKLAYAKAQREERSARRAAKKAAERAALIEQIKAQILAGEL